MDRKGFLKSTMIATGSLLLGGAGICRFLNDKEPADGPFPRTIEKIHCGNMKKVLVIMSAGTKLGNTDRLTDAYIKGLVERGHSVTKVYLGSMRIEG
ncbi:flavodoxin family protein, partial [Bacteroides thetaiotaomicron]